MKTLSLVTLIVTLSACSALSDFDAYTFVPSDAGADSLTIEDADQVDGASDAGDVIDASADAGTDATVAVDAGADTSTEDAAADDAGDAGPMCCGAACSACGGLWQCFRNGEWSCQPFPCVTPCP